jgi:hypothetical protein
MSELFCVGTGDCPVLESGEIIRGRFELFETI